MQGSHFLYDTITDTGQRYRSYSLHNYKQIPQIRKLDREALEAIEVVSRVLPFKTNNYVINELIDWDNAPDDPIFTLTFPRRDMLRRHHYQQIRALLRKGADKKEIIQVANAIRMELNPHPAGQTKLNIPTLDEQKLWGLQHKYEQTVLLFPQHGQTCHAYCTFCFRWPQFVGINDLKQALSQSQLLVEYLQVHPEVTDLLITGGDPLIMSAKNLAIYIDPLIEGEINNLQNIRIGTKSLSYWPYRFITDKDADSILRLFEQIVQSGKHLSIMAHFSHPRELETPAVEEAIRRIRETGAEIRTQSPLLKYINDNPEVWADMWKKQVQLGCVPYYMFIVRDTGAQHYFSLPLEKAWQIFRQAYQQTSGLARTVRGPSMSATPGKIQVLGISKIGDQKVFVLRMLQGRDPEWVHRPFFAKYDPDAIWINDLKPAFSDKFFFET